MADVHANLHALNAVLAALAKEGIEEIWCLGDVVGYGGDPEACVAIVRERCAGTVRGNHDAAAVEAALRASFNPHARAAIERQADLLSRDALEWLGGASGRDRAGRRGAPPRQLQRTPRDSRTCSGARDAARELAALTGRWGFYGHTHVPALWRMDADGRVEDSRRRREAGSTPLDRPGRYLVNPGAVGQPRDGDPRAACAIFDRGSESRALPARSLRHRSRAVVDPARGHAGIEAERLERGL